MIIHSEIGSSYHHKPNIHGVDYSPLIMEVDEEALVKGERPPKEIPSAIPPPIFLRRRPTDSLFMYFRFPPRSLDETLGVVYIVVSRSKQFGGRSIEANRTDDGETEVGGAPREGERTTRPHFHPVDPSWPTSAHFFPLEILNRDP
jgi:hypothetical protein